MLRYGSQCCVGVESKFLLNLVTKFSQSCDDMAERPWISYLTAKVVVHISYVSVLHVYGTLIVYIYTVNEYSHLQGITEVLTLGIKCIFPCSFGNKRTRLLTR